MARSAAMVKRITSMVNRAYYESLKDELGPHATSYERLNQDEVIDRLCMGDAGSQANRVLHIAHRGAALTPASVVGCMSSTFQPPWTEDGCGHWGLVVVDPDVQGQGIASVLVAAAERRLAGACSEIQIEYHYTPGHAHSEKLMKWYEERCGFRCAVGRRRDGGTQFRKCRKKISPEEIRGGRALRLSQIREQAVADLVAAQAAAAQEGCLDPEAAAAVGDATRASTSAGASSTADFAGVESDEDEEDDGRASDSDSDSAVELQ